MSMGLDGCGLECVYRVVGRDPGVNGGGVAAVLPRATDRGVGGAGVDAFSLPVSGETSDLHPEWPFEGVLR